MKISIIFKNAYSNSFKNIKPFELKESNSSIFNESAVDLKSSSVISKEYSKCSSTTLNIRFSGLPVLTHGYKSINRINLH